MINISLKTREFTSKIDVEATFRFLSKQYADRPFLLESVFDATSTTLAKKFSSNSLICLNPLLAVSCKNGKCTLAGEKSIISQLPKGLITRTLKKGETPVDFLRKIYHHVAGSNAQRRDENFPNEHFGKSDSCIKASGDSCAGRFSGGFVGFAAYELAGYFERLPKPVSDPLGLPDIYFILHQDYLLYDHNSSSVRLLTFAENAEARFASLERSFKKQQIPKAKLNQFPPYKVSSNKTREEFMSMVEAAKAYIRIGDIFQVVPSRRLCIESAKPAMDTYESLRALNPSPYMFCLDFGEFMFIGASPETQVRLTNGLIELRPIAGTRRRGSSATEEEAISKELLADEKELAEHTMLVDLARNDIGRVCAPGTLSIPESFLIEKYSHVQHIVSHVTGKLVDGCDMFDVFRHTFPAGTVSGAPKIRAMEIISELEGGQRGAYAGAVGYFDLKGNLDFCISIRMIVKKGNLHYLQAGAGIVADSKPDREYVETMEKLNSTVCCLTGKTLEE
ncbi:anthranilate synthase component I [Candidatus Micrarchaeota archaeon CG08_land_8_20_14_0_20_49_17]|nr:MAG: anthranilate synthase component I [Candidatus Micrarchaeota archaeon CG08_land_8_20_14_0_20_49_17]